MSRKEPETILPFLRSDGITQRRHDALELAVDAGATEGAGDSTDLLNAARHLLQIAAGVLPTSAPLIALAYSSAAAVLVQWALAARHRGADLDGIVP